MKILRLFAYAILFLFSVSVVSANESQEFIGEIINVNQEYEIAFTDLSSYHLKINDIVGIYRGNEVLTYLQVAESSSAISKLIPVNKDNEKFSTDIDFKDLYIGDQVHKVTELQEPLPIVNKVYVNLAEELPVEPSLKEDKVIEKVEEKVVVQENIEPIKVEEQVPTQVEMPTNKQPLMDSNVDTQFKKLSDNYVQLSNSLNQIISEKRKVEQKLSESNIELEEANKQIQLLETENSKLLRQIQTINIDQANNEKDRQIKELQQTIVQLKKKFEKMQKLIKGSK